MKTEWIWIDGKTMPLAEAKIGVEDRGFQFADGVYEVIRIYGGVPFTLEEHLDRLQRSAEGIELPLPMPTRNHFYPDASCRPTMLFYLRELPPIPEPEQVVGAKLVTVEDERWKRCWVKSIALLPNILAKNAAARKGADEALFVDERQQVWECSASNIFGVSRGTIFTPPIGPKVLPGITRQAILDLEPAIEVRPVSVEEIRNADELFITSTTREIGWVSQLDGRTIASRPGAVTLDLHKRLQQFVADRVGTVATASR
jgi:D-alanine transaminase